MSSPVEPSQTSPSLLARVRQSDADAWERLCELYTPLVYGWCRRAGLRENDAADAVQEVFRSVFEGIAGFRGPGEGQAGGSFRGWLWTITRNQVRLFFRRQRGQPVAAGGTDAQLRMIAHPDGCEDDPLPEPDEADDRRRLLHRALDLVRADFSAATWEAFTRIALQGHSAQEVALELGQTENAVRQAKFRVLRRLRDELDGAL